jgi:hypothetical protein
MIKTPFQLRLAFAVATAEAVDYPRHNDVRMRARQKNRKGSKYGAESV